MTKEKESDGGTEIPKTKLQVIVTYDSKKHDYEKYIVCTAIEYNGIWMQRKKNKNKNSQIILFDKLSEGEEFFNLYKDIEVFSISKSEISE
jgi:hypothetical protein